MAIFEFSHQLYGKFQLKTSIVGFALLCLTSVSVPLQAQEELPDQGIRLPSVSEYSLPPGGQPNPSANSAEGPSEEGAAPPQPAASQNPPTASSPAPAPAVRPNPSRTETAPPVTRRAQPAPVRSQPQIRQQQSTAPEPQVTPPIPEQSIESNEQSDESRVEIPAPIPAPDQAEAVVTEPVVPESSWPIWLIALGGALIAGGAGAFFWLRKGPATHEDASPVLAEQESAKPKPVRKPRSAAKIYSPPDPVAEPGRTPTTNDGFITTKVGMDSDVSPSAKDSGESVKASSTSAPASKTAMIDSDLQMEFFAEKASSTLMNAVIGFRLKLTNNGAESFKNIKIFGELLQADQNAALIPAMQKNNIVDQVEMLEAGDSVEIPGEVRLPLVSINPIAFNNQALFIPLARFALEMETADNTTQQQSASFIVGREHEPPQAKMAPFRLDLGPRSFGPVGQRPVQI